MNAYEHAMKIEKDGEKYYRELAKLSPYTGLKNVFTILADEEVKHYNIFKELLQHHKVDLSQLNINLKEETIFEELNQDKGKFNLDLKEIEFYKDAISVEEGLESFYLKKANEVDSQTNREIFIQISKEEAKHKILLENIITFIQENNNAVASAEF